MTYRLRLLIYVGMLIILLVGMMTLSFKAARDVISAGADEHLRHAASRKQAALGGEVQQLHHYTGIIAGDLRLQTLVAGGQDSAHAREALSAYYERQFSSLRTHWHLILADDGEVLLGRRFPHLIEQMERRHDNAAAQGFFFESPKGVVAVASRPVMYQGKRIAVAAVARVLGQAWLNGQEAATGDYLLFFERAERILWSSQPQYRGVHLDPGGGMRLRNEDVSFRLRQIVYDRSGQTLPRLWLGISESRLIDMLAAYERWLFVFAALGSLAVLLVGWLMLRNFSRPLEQLMDITEEMINGKLPVMARSQANTEMDQLVNRFADVLDALRREQSKLQRAHKKLQETAITDSLTGLYNRRYLQEVTPGLLGRIVRDGRYLTAVLLDLDYFKSINDCHGHLGGDAVLVHFARLLKHNSRANDFLFRIGGEEFLILNVAENPADSVALANKIRELVNQSPANYQGAVVPMTVSAGISCCDGRAGGDISLSGLMRSADKALYEAKSQGRNRVVTHASCRDATVSIESVKKQARLTLIGGTTPTGGDS